MAFSNVSNFSRWLYVSMAVRLSDCTENQRKSDLGGNLQHNDMKVEVVIGLRII